MTETVMEAFRRMAEEHLTEFEMQVTHTEDSMPRFSAGSSVPVSPEPVTAVTLTVDSGLEDALERVAQSHVDATHIKTDRMHMIGGEHHLEAQYSIRADPHEEYEPTASLASATGSDDESGETPTEDETDCEGEESEPETTLTLTTAYGRSEDGTIHLHTEEGGQWPCGTKYPGAAVTNISKNYGSLYDFLEDEDVCDYCAKLLIAQLNLPKAEVPRRLR